MALSPFHILLHAAPSFPVRRHSRSIGGRLLDCLDLDPRELEAPLAISFDDAFERLSRISRLHVEPDGSFVWVSHTGRDYDCWQLDGVLHDRGDYLQYVELKGNCAPDALETLLDVFRSPPATLVVQLLRHAVFVEEAEFRRWLADRA